MYLFDTDVISRLMKRGKTERLTQRLARIKIEDQATSSITIGELSYGSARVGRVDLMARAHLILAGMKVFGFDQPAAEIYGPLRARPESRGVKLAEADLRIAAIARLHDCTLVTGNIRHFGRVEGVRVEDWLTG